MGLELCRGGFNRFGSPGSRLAGLGGLVSPSLRGQQRSRSWQSRLSTRHCIIHCTCHTTPNAHSLCPKLESALTTRHCIIHCTCHATANGHPQCPRRKAQVLEEQRQQCKMTRAHHALGDQPLHAQGSVALIGWGIIWLWGCQALKLI